MGMTDTELAWAAGFADGEGCFSVKRATPGRRPAYPRFDLGQTDIEPLERFIVAVGFGKVNGPYPPRGLRKKPKYVVTIVGDRWWAMIDLLWPYLCTPKKDQIRRVATAINEGC